MGMDSVRDLLEWPAHQPGRNRDYSWVLQIVVGIRAVWWLLCMLPFVYTVLAGLVTMALLLAWVL